MHIAVLLVMGGAIQDAVYIMEKSSKVDSSAKEDYAT